MVDKESEIPKVLSQPDPIKPINSSKPPVKSWSNLLNSNSTSPNPLYNPSINVLNSSNKSACKSGSISGSNSSCTSRPTSVISLEADIESFSMSTSTSYDMSSEILNQPTSIHSRPIINPGNRCYMISVLQALLHTRPFSNYLQKYFFKLESVPSIISTGRFPLLSALKSFYSQFTSTLQSNPVPIEAIDEIFFAINGDCEKFSFSEQEDSEEFLTSFLDILGEEFMAIQAQKLLKFTLPYSNEAVTDTAEDDEDNNNWFLVGPKHKVATTRRTPLNQNPITNLFSGSFQSLYRSPGIRPSITFEPFTILSLSLINDHDKPIHSISGAIEHLLRLEDLGKKCSKQLSFSSLPPILIIQLKRFIFKPSTQPANHLELHKITRPINISPAIQLPQNAASHVAYNLYALVNHHGSSIHNGHYTAIIKDDHDGGKWLNFNDDQRIKSVNPDDVMNQNPSVYLLFYERQ